MNLLDPIAAGFSPLRECNYCSYVGRDCQLDKWDCETCPDCASKHIREISGLYTLQSSLPEPLSKAMEVVEISLIAYFDSGHSVTNGVAGYSFFAPKGQGITRTNLSLNQAVEWCIENENELL